MATQRVPPQETVCVRRRQVATSPVPAGWGFARRVMRPGGVKWARDTRGRWRVCVDGQLSGPPARSVRKKVPRTVNCMAMGGRAQGLASCGRVLESSSTSARSVCSPSPANLPTCGAGMERAAGSQGSASMERSHSAATASSGAHRPRKQAGLAVQAHKTVQPRFGTARSSLSPSRPAPFWRGRTWPCPP